jgi:hypothetical protein
MLAGRSDYIDAMSCSRISSHSAMLAGTWNHSSADSGTNFSLLRTQGITALLNSWSFRIDSYFFAVFATLSSPAIKSAALLNSMISQATGAFLSMIMV